MARFASVLRPLGGLAAAGALLLSSPQLTRAADRCPGAETTLALRECLGRQIEASDQKLSAALAAIARSAQSVPDVAFQQGWATFLEQHAGGSDPAEQLRAFQQARRRICFYANGGSFQGSGFGVFVLSCELDLNDALLQQLRS